jgi:ribosomal protein L25 (general stress protein Ctc)
MLKKKSEAVTRRRAGNIMAKIIGQNDKEQSINLHTKLKIEHREPH